MSDTYGALQIPVQLPPVSGPGAGLPVDRVLDTFGAYLKAILNARVGAMWTAVAPGLGAVVHRVFTANPEDVLINESYLPALFVWRSQPGRQSRLADDWWITEAVLTVMWLLEPGDVVKREKRMRMQPVIASNIHSALAMGRDPAWVDFGDTEPTAAARGSILIDRAGLMRLPEVQQSQLVPVTLAPENSDPVTYRAVSTQVITTERFKRDPAAHGTPSAAGISVVQGGANIVTSQFGP